MTSQIRQEISEVGNTPHCCRLWLSFFKSPWETLFLNPSNFDPRQNIPGHAPFSLEISTRGESSKPIPVNYLRSYKFPPHFISVQCRFTRNDDKIRQNLDWQCAMTFHVGRWLPITLRYWLCRSHALLTWSPCRRFLFFIPTGFRFARRNYFRLCGRV